MMVFPPNTIISRNDATGSAHTLRRILQPLPFHMRGSGVASTLP